MLNRVDLIGRMTKDPDARRTEQGTAITRFTLAVDRDFGKDEKGVDFINVVAWRNTAEFAAKYLTKGRLVCVSGRLQVREWKDKDGDNHYATEVVADNVYPLDRKSEESKVTSDPYTAPVKDAFAGEVADDTDLPF